MNLLERNHTEQEEKEQEGWEEQEQDGNGMQERAAGKDSGDDGEKEWHEPKIPVVLILMAIIVVLLICILALLFFSPDRKGGAAKDSQEALQQDMLDYASEQKQNDKVTASPSQGIIVVESPEMPEEAEESPIEETPEVSGPEEETAVLESETIDKTAIVIDIEDENDISYTKEFIMNEMYPYFEDNNLDAIWDLAHLKRYVKLSADLKDTGTYYYQGGVDGSGKPDGVGLAIYENNTYYFGSWSHGLRSGNGRWIRFYIDEIGAKPTKKNYQSHSYSGMWSNDLPNGEGAEHYDIDSSYIRSEGRVIQNVVGNFTNGLYDGEMYANTIDYLGNVDEWDAVAHQGVFDLWRDMSRIGECSVWRNKTDYELCLDIDKSENKNQGIRELFVSVPAAK
ncbi:MAG: hypothetical protein NC341_02410 [Blautia sp.]|nr:hypothetical protein [Blautia sp.]MCM1200470.1 hypothetical protein [Bacteroides fragilis]